MLQNVIIKIFFLTFTILGDHSRFLDLLIANQHATVPGREREGQQLCEYLDIRGGLDAQGL